MLIIKLILFSENFIFLNIAIKIITEVAHLKILSNCSGKFNQKTHTQAYARSSSAVGIGLPFSVLQSNKHGRLIQIVRDSETGLLAPIPVSEHLLAYSTELAVSAFPRQARLERHYTEPNTPTRAELYYVACVERFSSKQRRSSGFFIIVDFPRRIFSRHRYGAVVA